MTSGTNVSNIIITFMGFSITVWKPTLIIGTSPFLPNGSVYDFKSQK